MSDAPCILANHNGMTKKCIHVPNESTFEEMRIDHSRHNPYRPSFNLHLSANACMVSHKEGSTLLCYSLFNVFSQCTRAESLQCIWWIGNSWLWVCVCEGMKT